MNARQLAEWILTLPKDIQEGEVTSIVHGSPFTAKRVVAFRNGSDCGIYVESMGTHIRNAHTMDTPFYISHGGAKSISPLRLNNP